MKCRILWTVRGTGPKVWPIDALMQAVDCTDHRLLLRCCHELIDEQLIHPGPEGPPPDLGPAAEGLPSGETLGDLPPGTVVSFDPPIPTPEQLKEHEELLKLGNRLESFLNASLKPASGVQNLAEAEIEELMGDDAPELSATEKKIRRYAIKRYGTRWRDIKPGTVRTEAQGNKLYEKEVGPLHHISTFRRALGRKLRRPRTKIF